MSSVRMQYKQEGKKNPVERTFLAETIDEVRNGVKAILAEEPERTLVSGSIEWTSTQKLPDDLSGH